MTVTARDVRDRHLSLNQRAHLTAGLGDQLDVDAAVIARAAADGPAYRGMF